LDKEECRLLVAGETSAGKSTFLNLLLGKEILPVALESSTSTVCEVKYGATEQAVVHLREPTDQGQRQISIPLDGPDHEERRKELKGYIHVEGADRDSLKLPPAEKIEIFWPLPLLQVRHRSLSCFQGGIVLVDSPGVGESEMLNKVVADYMPKVFAFLYIIDIYRAGGVQQDRLGKLLKLYTKQENTEDFNPESAMFICNKWDLVLAEVSPEEQDKLKANTFRKLSQMWPGLKETQVFFVSTKKALRLGGILSEDFSKVLDGLDLLLQKSLDIKLDTQYRWLTRLLRVALLNINVQLNFARQNLDKESKMKKYQEVKNYLQSFQDKAIQGIEKLESMLGNNIKSTKDFLSNLVKNGQLKKDVMAVENLPVIVSWVIPSGRKVKHQEVLAKLVHEMRGRWSATQSLEWETISSTECILKIYWDQANVDTPLVDVLMQALSSDLEELLTKLVERQMQPQRDLLSKMDDGIKKLEGIMDLTIDQTFKDSRSSEEILQTYEPQSRDINNFLGQLAMFHLTKMRKYEYDLDCITGWTDTRNRMAGGSYGEVFKVKVPWKGGETREVALKLGVNPYDITTEQTAWDFLLEEENLRILKGEHIVEYYGTACRREGGGLRLGLVMELCEGTLEKRIVGKRHHSPARWGSDPEKQAAAFSYTQNLAVQLCEGLRQIHKEGYIHRDLKLSNILVTKDTVKLADVGLTKQEVKITGTVAGTPLYTAPEVKERQIYDRSADIYSLGLILWEMWYGWALYGMEGTEYLAEMQKCLKEGRDIRMPRWNKAVPPTRIPEWTSLINDCLQKDPRERPKIQDCLDRIKAMEFPVKNYRTSMGEHKLRRSAEDSGIAADESCSTPSSKVTDTSAQSAESQQRDTESPHRDDGEGLSGNEGDSGATALVHRKQSGKLLELQKQVTDIVRESHPNLNFVPDTNKEADEKRIELNRTTLKAEVFSSDVNLSLDSVIFQLIERRMKSVCRINWPGGAGTGFLLSKGKVLTCYHVYELMHKASSSFHEANHYTAAFFVSVDRKYEVPLEAPAAMRICHSKDLDYAILQLAVGDVEMERNLEDLPFLGQCVSEGEDSRKMVVLVGHPHGGNKIVDFGRIAGVDRCHIIHIHHPNLIQEDERKPLYDTSVMFHGSSGSPGFDSFGNVVLMHTRGFYPDNSRKSVIERGTRLTAIRDHARQTLAPEVYSEIFPDPPMSVD
ncbi:PREDICTED: uncharacterized protein LOC109486917, partial [Branchiostoma belcheri]|uniref:Uncharacterized protein LOC109486917 n=1 Tax=Branchiostoma belcheri TaxID=7741 RepID=A0A6P5ATJ8_BRABE